MYLTSVFSQLLSHQKLADNSYMCDSAKFSDYAHGARDVQTQR